MVEATLAAVGWMCDGLVVVLGLDRLRREVEVGSFKSGLGWGLMAVDFEVDEG